MRVARSAARAALLTGVALLCMLLLTGTSRTLAQAAKPVASFDVKCGDTDIGKVVFSEYKDTTTYDGTGKATSNYEILIQGGFDPNANWKLPDKHGYRWLQTLNSSAPIYGWQNAGTTYMDRARVGTAPNKQVADGSPFYRFFRGPGNGFALGFEDNPSRLNTVTQPFSGTWTLYLVCADLTEGDVSNANQAPPKAGKREIDVITSFQWGFRVADGKLTLNPSPPTNQTGAAFDTTYAALGTAFGADPDAKTFKDSWTLEKGCCGAPVPEGSALVQFSTLGTLAAAVLGFRRRRRA